MGRERGLLFQRHDWALVTGASSGIGREFCRQFASVGLNLVLVSRRAKLLDDLAEELAARNGIETMVLAQDLCDPRARRRVRELVDHAGVRVRLLVNNAGVGGWGPFESSEPERYERMIELNATAMVGMCAEFLAQLSSHPRSAVINVSSQAAFQPVPYMAVYAATKAFVYSFSLALYEEWRSRGVHVQTLVPGPTQSEFDEKAGAYASALQARDSPRVAVETALAHLAGGKPLVASTGGIWRQRLFGGLLPPGLLVREVAKMFKPPKQRAPKA